MENSKLTLLPIMAGPPVVETELGGIYRRGGTYLSLIRIVLVRLLSHVPTESSAARTVDYCIHKLVLTPNVLRQREGILSWRAPFHRAGRIIWCVAPAGLFNLVV